jgi:uncharacterized protein YjbI with pentapeptide repeats
MHPKKLPVVNFKIVLVIVMISVCALTLNGCFKKEPRRLSTDEYILLNQVPPLWLVDIDFAGADLRAVNLLNADLRSADLSGANLRGANLSGANLTYADLRNADLTNANLSGANLRGTNLSGAAMNNVNMSNAIYNAETRWRADFDPEGAGAKLE